MAEQHVLVTAGASGIGLAIARRFHAAGARVAICDVDPAALESAGAALPGLLGFDVDVSDAAAVAAMAGRLRSEFGRLGAVINNAGVAGPIGTIDTLDPDQWARCFAINVQGAFHVIRETLDLLRIDGGAIVNISTASTQTCPIGRAAYTSSKWALEGLTRSAARELGPQGIRVNAIRPGFMETPRMAMLLGRAAEARGVELETVEAEALGFISMRSKVQPEEIGELALFLASPAGRNISGQIIGVCGNAEYE